jgi:membrane protease YdiL (CAAX protease family)
MTAGSTAPGLFRFSVEGRRAPGLFVTGWLATIPGLALTVIGFAGGQGTAVAILLLLGLALLAVGTILLGGSQGIERRAAGHPYPGPSPVLLFLAIVAVTLVVASVVGIVLDAFGVVMDRAVGDLVSVGLQAVVFVGVVGLMVVGPGAVTWADMGLAMAPGAVARNLVRGALLAVPVIFLTGLVAAIVVPLVGETPPSPLPPTGSGTGLGLHLIAGAGIAPFAEEVVFRGAALTAWLRTAGAPAAIARSAVLFAAAHALGIGGTSFGEAAGLVVVATVARLPVAIALGWVYVRTGSLWASIGLHATFNAILLAASELAL